MKIKDLPKVDRPREKLEKYGPAVPFRSSSASLERRRERLSDSELLAILLQAINTPPGWRIYDKTDLMK